MNSRCWSLSSFLAVLFCVLWIATAIAIGVPCSQAQERSIERFGLSFPIEETTEISPGAVRVTVLGQTFVAHPGEIPDKVAEIYLSDLAAANAFSQDGLQDFIVAAAEARNISVVVSALRNIVRRKQFDTKSLQTTLDEVLSLPGAIKIAQAAAPILANEDLKDATPLYTVFVFITEYNLRWAKLNLNDVANNHRSGLLKYMQEEFDLSIRERRFSRAERLMLIVMDLYGSSEPVYRELRRIYQQAEDLQAAAKSFDANKLYPILDMCRTSERMNMLFGELVLEYFHKIVSRSIKAGDVEGALEILSRMSFDGRSPRTHELARQAIAKLPLFSSSFNDPKVTKLFAQLSGVDQSFRQSYFNYLLREIREAVRVKRWIRADNSLRRLIQIRPDPNPQNDELRFEIAHAMVKSGLASEATVQIESMQTGLSIGKRFILIFSGYYVSRWILWVTILFLVLIPFVLFVRERIRLARIVESGAKRTSKPTFQVPKPDSSKPQRKMGGDDWGEEEMKGGFSYSTIRRGLSPRMYEYVGLLRMFELGPEASLKMIKVAYRAAIKEVHPDLHPNPTEEQSQRFRDLTNAHERILELRNQLGLIDE